jgi:hypothetical protein
LNKSANSDTSVSTEGFKMMLNVRILFSILSVFIISNSAFAMANKGKIFFTIDDDIVGIAEIEEMEQSHSKKEGDIPDDSIGSSPPSEVLTELGSEGEVEEEVPSISVQTCSTGSDSEGTSCFSQRVSSYKAIVAAAGSSIISSSLTYPLDVKKIYLQNGGSFKWSDLKGWNRLSGLYKGFSSYVTATCISVGAGLSSYDFFRGQGWSPSAAGAFSALIGNTLSNPAWVYRTNATLSPAGEDGKPSYTRACFYKEVRKDPRAAARGLGVGLVANLPSQALYFELYNFLNQKIEELTHSSEGSMVGFGSHAVAGGIAKMISGIPAYPLDTARIRKNKTGLSYPEIIRTLYKEGGVRQFYKGFFYSSAKSSAGVAVYTYLYRRVMDGSESASQSK